MAMSAGSLLLLVLETADLAETSQKVPPMINAAEEHSSFLRRFVALFHSLFGIENFADQFDSAGAMPSKCLPKCPRKQRFSVRVHDSVHETVWP